MISAFANSLKIPELRERVFFTLAMVVVVRIGASITLPGVDATVLGEWLRDRSEDSSGAAQLAALLNVFSGGGLQNCAVFGLGIMPYISASIMMQLLTAVVPRLGKLAREDGGRQKINQYTRMAAIVLCIIQGGLLAKSLLNPGSNPFLGGIQNTITELGKPLVAFDNPTTFVISSIIVMTAGVMLLMWIGDQVTERGIGNGMSLIISVNIISGLPGAIVQVWKTYISASGEDPMKAVQLVILFAFLLIVIAAVISLTQAQRRISIQYAKRVHGRKVYGGQTQYMPLKVNYSGVMPIIFAQAILLFPAQIVQWVFGDKPWAKNVVAQLGGTGWVYYVLSAAMIFFFSYFWVATMFQPQQIADDLKRNGGYIPGVRPGKPTADFLDYTMGRLTFAGAIFLTVVAVLPSLLTQWMNVPPVAAQFFGGTSVLILVGVLLDIMRQVETHLIQRHYDGFLRKGKIRGRYDRPRSGAGRAAGASGGMIIWLYVAIGILIIVGMSSYLYYTGQ